ncbi:MAG: electron transport complex subunit RsxC [Azoarcus sp.]|jgi:electron transport complex protein RnfC|nr:electron transport complex subunit RsxC [Azoarcus sp.]
MGLMEKIFTRSWGVHPRDYKHPAADAPVRVMPMPERLYLSLAQHLGAPARPAVLVGQKVKKGEKIADPQGPVSAAIHAPTSGVIAAIGEIPAPHPSGLPVQAIILEADGRDEWSEALTACDNPLGLAPDEISYRVAAAGVVGMGGATFPSALKLSSSRKAGVTTLVMNGGECEPYLSCDDRLMRDKAETIIDGIRLMLHATGAKEAIVGIEDNKPEAIAAMRKAVAAHAGVRVRPIPARYPMGSEKQLVQTLTGREIPAGALPAEVGVVVHNVGTARAVSEAIRLGRPLISRLLTVNGGCVGAPGNIVAPVGALVEEVLAFAGGIEARPARLVMGGPMMGVSLPHARTPVIKGTSGILALNAAQAADSREEACIRCASCARACPIQLMPLDMARHIRGDDLKGALRLGLKDCIACGCCAYVCPAHIPLVQYFTYAKGTLAAEDRARQKAEATRRLAAARSERLAREAREKAEIAARRKAEREAAKAAAASARSAGEMSA